MESPPVTMLLMVKGCKPTELIQQGPQGTALLRAGQLTPVCYCLCLLVCGLLSSWVLAAESGLVWQLQW